MNAPTQTSTTRSPATSRPQLPVLFSMIREVMDRRPASPADPRAPGNSLLPPNARLCRIRRQSGLDGTHEHRSL